MDYTEITIQITKLAGATIMSLALILYLIYGFRVSGKITESISAIYLHLKGKKNIWHSIWIVIMSGCLLLFNIDVFRPLLTTAAALLALVGIFPMFYIKNVWIPHIIGASGSIIFMMLSFYFEFDKYIAPSIWFVVFSIVILLLSTCIQKIREQKTYWLENAAFWCFIIGLFFTIY